MRYIITLTLLCQICIPQGIVAIDLSEDERLCYKELAYKYGYKTIEYQIKTEDGYNLRLFRIPGRRGLPILLMHGILDSSDTWIIRGNTSLAITLANKGYDVWTGNCRGNRYSRSHLHLNPDSPEFWDFSFHEYGYYDLAVIIDTILKHTKAKKVNAIAHSQGSTIFYVLCSTRPQYNDKVNVLIGLAPVAFLHNAQKPLNALITFAPSINTILKMLNINEVFGDSSLNNLARFCRISTMGYMVCVYKLLFGLSGIDMEELESDFVTVSVRYIPTGTSRKNLYHFAQVGLRRQFAHYDYGRRGNYEKYNSSSPPEYNLSAVSMKVALFVGANDKISTIEDVELMRRRLPNVVKYLVLPHKKMNHVDFVWGRNMKDYLFPYIFEVLERYDVRNVTLTSY